MITIEQPTRWLGNSLFQIAAAVGVAEANGDSALIPGWHYYTDFVGPFALYRGEPYDYTHAEGGFHYTPVAYHSRMALLGYFQSEKYFSHCQHRIRSLFEFRDVVKTKCLETVAKLKAGPSCAVHVRRGDYLKLPLHHPVLPVDYYEQAMCLMCQRVPGVSFFVFSDDPVWCETSLPGTTVIRDHRDAEDLYLMSQCDHHIIANSSFSWWGQWLSKNPNKICVAPKVWHGPEYAHWIHDDLYTKDMVQM